MEYRADRERQSPVVGEKRETEAHDCVECPRGQSPVKGRRGYADGFKSLGIGGINSERGILKVIHRFQHAVKQQADCDSRRIDHGKPSDSGVLGHRVRTAEAHFSHPRENQKNAEQYVYVAGAHEKPVKLGGNPDARHPQHFRRFVLKQQRPDYESEYGDPRSHKYRNVYIKTEYLNISLPCLAAVPVFQLMSSPVLFALPPIW